MLSIISITLVITIYIRVILNNPVIDDTFLQTPPKIETSTIIDLVNICFDIISQIKHHVSKINTIKASGTRNIT